jgi:hypothetical protein
MKIGLFQIAVCMVLLSFNTVLSSQKYCLDNQTLYIEDSYYKVKNGEQLSYVFNETVSCEYGCSNETFTQAGCNQSESVTSLTTIGIVILGIVLLSVFYRLIGEMFG